MSVNYHFVLLLFCLSIKAQKNVDSEKFINERFINQNIENAFVADKINAQTLAEIKEKVKNAKQVKKHFVIDTLVFRTEELEYVIKQFDKNYKTSIKTSVFKKSQVLSRKVIDNIFDDKTKGWQYFEKNYGKRLFSFTQPIFIRDYSICFFYQENSCGMLCGSGTLSVYKKVNGKWEFFVALIEWTS
jgi:hypothetical protein